MEISCGCSQHQPTPRREGSWPRCRAPRCQPSVPRHTPMAARSPSSPDPCFPRCLPPKRAHPLSPHRDGGGRQHTSAGRDGGAQQSGERGGLQRSAPGDPRAHKGPFVAAAGARKEPLRRGGGRFLLAAPRAALVEGAMGRWGLSWSPGAPVLLREGRGWATPRAAAEGAGTPLTLPPPQDCWRRGPQWPVCRGR